MEIKSPAIDSIDYTGEKHTPRLQPSFRRRFFSRSNERIGYLFILPSFVHLIVFLVVPIVFSLYLSFRDWNSPRLQDTPFIGLENYRSLLDDTVFWESMRNTAYYTVLSVPLGMALSLLVAVALNRKLKGVTLFRTMFFMPVISSWVAVSIVWITLLDPDVGIVNYALGLVGIPGVNWLSDPRWAMPALVMISIWKGLGFSMVIWLAGLQAIPRELSEAAAVDGATPWNAFFRITLPLLAPTTFFLLITGFIGSFQVFSPMYVITEGGPLGSTNVVVYEIYKRAFTDFRLGYASAESWALFAVIFAATLIQLVYLRRRGQQMLH